MNQIDMKQYNVIKIAKLCHELNRVWCLYNADYSQKSWDEAEQWQRESAIKGVVWRLANPDAPISAQHDAWMADKIAEGWVYGPRKDSVNKTHPCLVPYDQLPLHQKFKDTLFVTTVLNLRDI